MGLELGGPEPAATHIWRLQFGPCWCRTGPTDHGSFDFVRLRTTTTDPGSVRENILIVTSRVISGAARMYRQIHSEVPDPKLVVAAAACPSAARFWDEIPGGWTPADEVLPVDLHVEDCISGNPETLLTAVLSHLAGTPRVASTAAESVRRGY